MVPQSVTKIPLSNIQCMHKACPICWVSFKNTAILNTEMAFASSMQRNTAEKMNSKEVFMYLSKWTSRSLETKFIKEPPANCWKNSFELPAAGLKGLSMKLLCSCCTIHTQSTLHDTMVFCDLVRNNSIMGPVILMWSDSNTELTEFFCSFHWFWQQCHPCYWETDLAVFKCTSILTLWES